MERESLNAVCEAFLDEAMEYNDLPGLVVGVACGDEIFTGARGVRDVVTGDPLRADDVFHCASVSKLFTSAAIMKLVEAGVLRLDDRLYEILPELFDSPKVGPDHRLADPRWAEVRLWQMLSHTAGIGDVENYHWEEALTGETALSDYVHSAEVTGQPLLWEPGKGGFRYSNVAYEILGHIVSVKSGEFIRRVSGEKALKEDAEQELSYEAFVQRYLMRPAGMNDSAMLTFERIGVKAGESCPLMTDEIRRRNAAPEATTRPDTRGTCFRASMMGDQSGASSNSTAWHPMALPHEKAADRSIVPVRYYPYTRSHAPSSTLTSTAADLLRWAKAHMKGFAEVEAADRAPGKARGQTLGALLSLDSYQHIHYEYAEVPNNREKMGLGWFMRRQGGYQLYGHEGTDDGFRASLWICPGLELAIVVLSNLSGAPVKKLNKKLFERIKLLPSY